MENIATSLADTLNRAVVAYNDGNLFEAERLCRFIIAANPDLLDGLLLLANTQIRLGRGNEALATYNRALRLRPNDAVAINNRGVVLQQLQRFEEGLASYERAIALKPDFVDALYNRGATLQALRRFEDALGSYNRALALRPEHAAALHNRGIILHELKRFEDALASYQQALA